MKRGVRIALVGAIIVGVLAVVGYLFSGAEEAPSGGVTKQVFTQESPTGEANELLIQLRSLKTVELNAAVLDTTAFRALEDWSKPLPRIPAGRANPFAPINPFELQFDRQEQNIPGTTFGAAPQGTTTATSTR